MKTKYKIVSISFCISITIGLISFCITTLISFNFRIGLIGGLITWYIFFFLDRKCGVIPSFVFTKFMIIWKVLLTKFKKIILPLLSLCLLYFYWKSTEWTKYFVHSFFMKLIFNTKLNLAIFKLWKNQKSYSKTWRRSRIRIGKKPHLY